MTTTLASLRQQLMEAVLAGLPPYVTVYGFWPNNISAPCAIVVLGEGSQRKRNHWETTWRITVVGPAGDNQAATESVQEMTLSVAQSVANAFCRQVTWDRPATQTIAGNLYYAATLSTTLDVT